MSVASATVANAYGTPPVTKPAFNASQHELYAKWGAVLERIGRVKRSLSAAVATASVYSDGCGSFSMRLGDFFAKKISSNDTDIAIIKGVIAEIEGKSAADITLQINGQPASTTTLFSEIIDALDK